MLPDQPEIDPIDSLTEYGKFSNGELKPVDIYKSLSGRSSIIANLIKLNGIPPIWKRDPGFASLVRIILEQAVSLESARSVYEKCEKEFGEITPGSFLAAEEDLGKRFGFSRMKWKTCYKCAERIVQGEINLSPANRLEDTDLAKVLIKLPGIGQWTLDIYFLLVLQRPDIWPEGDRALQVAVSEAFGIENTIGRKKMAEIAEPWRPFRSWAARVFWYDYLIRRNRLTTATVVD